MYKFTEEVRWHKNVRYIVFGGVYVRESDIVAELGYNGTNGVSVLDRLAKRSRYKQLSRIAVREESNRPSIYVNASDLLALLSAMEKTTGIRRRQRILMPSVRSLLREIMSISENKTDTPNIEPVENVVKDTAPEPEPEPMSENCEQKCHSFPSNPFGSDLFGIAFNNDRRRALDRKIVDVLFKVVKTSNDKQLVCDAQYCIVELARQM